MPREDVLFEGLADVGGFGVGMFSLMLQCLRPVLAESHTANHGKGFGFRV